MRTRSLILFLPVMLGLAGCEPFIPTEFLDATRKTEGLAQFLAVQRSDQMTSGSVVLGEAGSLGRSGRVSVGLRATLVDGGTPSTAGTTVSVNGEQPNTFATESNGALAIAADAGVAIWRGLHVGETYVLGVTAVGSLTLLPAAETSDIDLDGGDGLSVGGGIRLGILEEGSRTPGLAFTGMVRNLPAMSLQTEPLPTDDNGTMILRMNGLTGTVGQWRLAASKQFGRFGVIAGGGEDVYEGHGDLEFERVGDPSAPFEAIDRTITFSRSTMFVGGSYRVGRWTLGAEIGRLGGDAATDVTPEFAGQGDWSKTYLSVGLRVGN
jgi:hypothetical protein